VRPFSKRTHEPTGNRGASVGCSIPSAGAVDQHARVAREPRIDVVSGVIALMLGWLVFTPFAGLDTDPFHDGLMLKPALDVASGQTLFRDTLMRYGPLTTWLQAAELMVLGRSLHSIRLATFFVYGLIACGLVMSWRLVLPRTLTILSCVLWFLLAPFEFASVAWSSIYALGFQAMALLALMCAVSSPRGRGGGWAGASGVLGGLSFLSRHVPLGVFTCVSVLAAYVVVGIAFPARRRDAARHFMTASAGTLVVVALFLLHLVWHGSLDAWWQQTVVWTWRESVHTGRLMIESLDFWWRHGLLFCALAVPLLWLVRDGRFGPCALALALAAIWAAVGNRFVNPVSLLTGTPAVALVLAFAWTVSRALRTRQAPTAETMMTLAAMIVCMASWTEAIPTGHPGHLFWALSASLGFSVLAAWQFAGRRTALVAAVLVLLSGQFIFAKAMNFWGRLTMPRVTLVQPTVLAGMRELPANAKLWTDLATVIDQYSRERPRWPMLLEGNNMVILALAPDLTNGDPSFLRYLNLPYDGELRAQFIIRERPLIFRQPRFTSEQVERAMQEVGYVTLFKWRRHGELLAPRDLPSNPNQPSTR
jgi:hypothetical protein